ncbi:MerR family transcriptional regulator [Flavicella marina]|uniref:MerR family transcriptional regulator n=1 Tax=Flavicella marina TaxID=1475951 RepID=UPI00126463AF|nr:MerR family transcriptional regulator [Flavicella marina]
MNKIKDSFLIQDLEILSGIKAHTIRIWEKRYGLLNPTRLNRNIRKYSLEDLQKLLNVSVLYSNGYKISKLSKLTDEALYEEARNIGGSTIEMNFYVNELIVAMYAFDSIYFDKVYSELKEKMNFQEIFVEVFVSLLKYIGLLWQTDAILPSHEHFVSNLIYQKIVLQSAQLTNSDPIDDKVYVLFLPWGEMHGIGLLFLDFVLKSKGFKTIYLGGGVPFPDLELINSKFESIHWICSFVIDKTQEEKDEFISQFAEILKDTSNEVTFVGRVWENTTHTNKAFSFYPSLDQLPFFK